MTQWKKLQPVPFGYGIPICLNDHEIILSERRSKAEFQALYKYDVNSSTWNEFFKYPKEPSIYDQAISYDKLNNTIYICNYYGQIITFDLNNNTIKASLYKDTIFKQLGSDPSSIIIDGELHIIGGYQNNRHLIWKKQNNSYHVEHTFTDLGNGFFDTRLFYIKSKQWILMMGMHDANTGTFDDIYSYLIEDKKWTKFGIKLPQRMSGFGSIMSSDEKYIITFGGMNDHFYAYNDDIFIIDLENMIMNKSQLKCPEKGCFHALLVGNRINGRDLVIGFIKQYWNLDNFIDDLLRMIIIYYVNESVHLFSHSTHWEISVDDILNSVTETC